MLKRILFILVLAFAPAPALADAAGVRDRIVAQLRDDGYSEIRMSRTLLGRMRFVATRADAEREIVVNPNTGVILRDYIRFLKRGGGGGADNGDEDDDDDDDDDDEDDDDEDNSGSGSSNSGSGSDDDDDDDDESDNSGSGSSSSGSGSDDDD